MRNCFDKINSLSQNGICGIVLLCRDGMGGIVFILCSSFWDGICGFFFVLLRLNIHEKFAIFWLCWGGIFRIVVLYGGFAWNSFAFPTCHGQISYVNC
jgi:hypothetical protein